MVISYPFAHKSGSDWWCYKWLQPQDQLQYTDHSQLLLIMGLDPPVLFQTTLMTQRLWTEPTREMLPATAGIQTSAKLWAPYLRVNSSSAQIMPEDWPYLQLICSFFWKPMSGIFKSSTLCPWAGSDQGSHSMSHQEQVVGFGVLAKCHWRWPSAWIWSVLVTQ